MSDKLKAVEIISKAENIADALLRHLSETECDHKIHEIAKEVFGPSLDIQDQHQNLSNRIKEVTT